MTAQPDLLSLISEIRQLLDCYNADLSGGKPEAGVDDWLIRIEALVPNGRFSDLLFWGERERTEDEAIEEAAARELLFRSRGELALLLHIEAQLVQALARRREANSVGDYAARELADVRRRIAALAGNVVH